MEIKEIIERLSYISDDSDGNLCDEDIRALKEAVFWLRCRCLDEKVEPENPEIQNLREYAANHIGEKVFIKFNCANITICGSEEQYLKDVARLQKEFPDGVFTIVGSTDLQSDEDDDLLIYVGHNLIDSAYPYKEDK